jgi:hypothetical protein
MATPQAIDTQSTEYQFAELIHAKLESLDVTALQMALVFVLELLVETGRATFEQEVILALLKEHTEGQQAA